MSDLEQSNGERLRGKVKWFNNSKGFGFIVREGESDVFCHFRAIKAEGYRTLTEGQEVEYSLSKSDKGYEAVDVEVVD